MTFFYRSYNRCVYKRTADIDSFMFYGVSLDSGILWFSDLFSSESEKPWEGIYSIDYSGRTQDLTHGDKCNFCILLNDRNGLGLELVNQVYLVYHYNAKIPFEKWKRDHFRPYIYINISFGSLESNEIPWYSRAHRQPLDGRVW